ncbi:methyltransferase domain-containing protein [Baffinella frigidus]|nr:methyltransferase domain-containing protein [Cryptophyta sp. CCMP2293]
MAAAAPPAEVDPARGGGLGRTGAGADLGAPPIERLALTALVLLLLVLAAFRQEGESGEEPVRVFRKRSQVESFILVLRAILPPAPAPGAKSEGAKRLVVVDFGCGGGNLTVPLAWAFPHCDFIGVDMKDKSVAILNSRAASAGLSNCRGVTCLIEDYSEAFDVSVALHACGNATDLAMESAFAAKAAYITCPCCVGKLKFSL